jgi:hypothetical protein
MKNYEKLNEIEYGDLRGLLSRLKNQTMLIDLLLLEELLQVIL